MPNLFKHNATGTESNSLFKGDWAINLKEHGGGPTGTTGFYNGIDIPTGGYAIYGPGNHVRIANDDTELLFLVGKLGGDNRSVSAALTWAVNTTDVVIVDRLYESIVTDGLVLNLDAGFTASHPRSGDILSDLVNSNNVSLINGASFNPAEGGISFDGVDDRGTFPTPTQPNATSLTYNVWFKGQSSVNAVSGYGYIIHNNGISTSTGQSYLTFGVHGVTGKYYAAMNGQYNAMQTSISQNSSNYYMMTLTWDGTTQSVYVNGSLENSRALSDGFALQSSWSPTFGLCDQRDGTYRPFDGHIYIINSYDRALSQSEVQANFDAQKTRFGL